MREDPEAWTLRLEMRAVKMSGSTLLIRRVKEVCSMIIDVSKRSMRIDLGMETVFVNVGTEGRKDESGERLRGLSRDTELTTLQDGDVSWS